MGKSQRLKLSTILHEIMPVEHQANVYFQPGPRDTLKFPCIVYERDNASMKYADNSPYAFVQRYQVTYIDHEPDSDVIDKLAALPLSSYSRHFAVDGRNHDVFVIYK